MHFFGQREDEKVVLLLRRHWSVLNRSITKATVLLAIPVAGVAAIFIIFPMLSEQPYRGLILYIFSLHLLFLWAWFFLKLADYYLDVWIITDERIVNIEQTGLFKRTSSTLNLDNIQDITTEVSGLSATLFRYGNLHIQTAAEKERFSIERIGNPEKVKAVIMDLYHNALAKEKAEMFGRMSGEKNGGMPPVRREDSIDE